MSGPAHGVAFVIGHEIGTSVGAGFTPSVATRTLIVLGELQRCDQDVALLELVEPEIGAHGAVGREGVCRRGVPGGGGGVAPGVAGAAARIGGTGRCVGTARSLVGRGRGRSDVLRDDGALAVERGVVVGHVGEPRLHVGGAAIRGEDIAVQPAHAAFERPAAD